MSDTAFTIAAPYALTKPSPASNAARAARTAATEEHSGSAEIARQSKVKTEMRTAHSFTYTFYDAKTLEIIGYWPQTAMYRTQNAAIAPSATLRAVL